MTLRRHWKRKKKEKKRCMVSPVIDLLFISNESMIQAQYYSEWSQLWFMSLVQISCSHQINHWRNNLYCRKFLQTGRKCRNSCNCRKTYISGSRLARKQQDKATLTSLTVKAEISISIHGELITNRPIDKIIISPTGLSTGDSFTQILTWINCNTWFSFARREQNSTHK